MIVWLAWLATTAFAKPTISVGYHGDFVTHPGAAGRVTWDLAGSERLRLEVETQVGGWWHPRNVVALYGRGGPALRLDGKRNGTYALFVHGGAAYGFFATPTYELVDEEVRTVALAGRPWAVVTPGLEFGRRTPKAVFDGWFVRPQMGFRVPTFHGAGIDIAVEAGIRFGGGA